MTDETETVEIDLAAALQGALMSYSEWLDVNGALRPVKNNDPGVRGIKTHPELIDAFINGKGKAAL